MSNHKSLLFNPNPLKNLSQELVWIVQCQNLYRQMWDNINITKDPPLIGKNSNYNVIEVFWQSGSPPNFSFSNLYRLFLSSTSIYTPPSHVFHSIQTFPFSIFHLPIITNKFLSSINLYSSYQIFLSPPQWLLFVFQKRSVLILTIPYPIFLSIFF